MAKQDTSLAVQNSEIANTSTMNLSGLNLLAGFKEDGPIAGLELTASDLKLPRFRLMQPTSLEVTQQKVQAGTFYNPVTGESVKELPCTLLLKNSTRVMWEKVFKRGDKPVCRSFDNKISFDGKRECAKCEFSAWKNDEDNSKPMCNLSYGWVALSRLPDSEGQPFRIIIPGKSVSFTKDFLTQIAAKRLAPFMFKVILYSEFMQNDKGAFYVIKYKFDGHLGTEVLASLGFTEQDVATNPEKMNIFSAKVREAKNSFEDAVNMYDRLFKEAVEAEIESGPIIVEESEVKPDGALF